MESSSTSSANPSTLSIAMNILLIDDEPRLCESFARLFSKLGHQVTSLNSGKEALQLQEAQLIFFDLALVDMNMAEMDGFQTGLRLKERVPHLVTIMLTADDRLETVVKALRDSKFDDYLCKQDVARDAMVGSPRLQETLIRAESLLFTRKQLHATEKALSQQHQLNSTLRSRSVEVQQELIGESPAFKEVLKRVHQVAPSEAATLIRGEIGTGKGLIAREIHRHSRRAKEPFVAINCCAVPCELLESELFGHEKGAFTGANTQRDGFFKLANQGTLFLDEIGDIPLELQVKLLRVLQEKEVIPLGSCCPIPVDVRVICSTNRDLRQKMETGEFRKDLFYRLNVFPIYVPPLRERIGDLPILINYFIERKASYKTIHGILPEALTMLSHYFWEGNIRELENLVERAIVVAQGEYLTQEDFPSDSMLGFPMPPMAPSQMTPMYSPVTVMPPVMNDFESVWMLFVKAGCQLWKFRNSAQLYSTLGLLLENAEYVKKGHFGRLILKKPSSLTVEIEYLNVEACQYQEATLIFEFLSSLTGESPHAASGRPVLTGNKTIIQPVLKGLPDTYIFDLLYPPAKKHESDPLSPQLMIRALVLRYAQEKSTSKNLKRIFGEIMSFLITAEMVRKISGLEHDGLEAVRACLCSNSHLFARNASQLKTNPEAVAQLIRKIFLNYSFDAVHH
ncbi:sigma-54 dependent transcriptional regulator [Deltaproteobacteria bacterium TL4]